MSRAGSGKEATEGRHGIIHARGRSSVALINIIWVVMPAGGVERNDYKGLKMLRRLSGQRVEDEEQTWGRRADIIFVVEQHQKQF